MADRSLHHSHDRTADRLAQAPNLNRLWADILVEELVRNGVRFFCLASGSRSAPLATAVAAHPHTEVLVHFDERGCAFAALGWARATGKPACWITTSGTALANGFPAIVEASMDGVPLIAVTADRPPELRDVGANQTIQQAGIFGSYVRWHVDLPPPDAAVSPAVVLTTVDQAVHRALQPAGPVHLNLMFRDPLAPEVQSDDLPRLPHRWLANREPYTRYTSSSGMDAVSTREVAGRLTGVQRGLVVAGRLRTRTEADAALELAERLGWPLLPDVCSQLRLGGDHPNLCPGADLVVADQTFAQDHKPEAVIYVGSRGVSKRIDQFLAGSRPDPFIVVRDDPFRVDPDHVVSHRIQADIEVWCRGIAGAVEASPATEWLASWRDASIAAEGAVSQELEAIEGSSEPGTARTISRLLPPGWGLFLGSSMPVRDMATFAAAESARPELVCANRGASGIDGTIATAAGLARGMNRPVAVLLGDLALLHDLNSLAILRHEDQLPVIVVVMNNDGGGIFHFLPIADYPASFESMFGTPHGMRFGDAARQFGLEYAHLEYAEGFEKVFGEALQSGRSTLIEVVTDRRENRALHDILYEIAAHALGDQQVFAAPPP